MVQRLQQLRHQAGSHGFCSGSSRTTSKQIPQFKPLAYTKMLEMSPSRPLSSKCSRTMVARRTPASIAFKSTGMNPRDAILFLCFLPRGCHHNGIRNAPGATHHQIWIFFWGHSMVRCSTLACIYDFYRVLSWQENRLIGDGHCFLKLYMKIYLIMPPSKVQFAFIRTKICVCTCFSLSNYR
jgi:hypothetical protein